MAIEAEAVADAAGQTQENAAALQHAEDVRRATEIVDREDSGLPPIAPSQAPQSLIAEGDTREQGLTEEEQQQLIELSTRVCAPHLSSFVCSPLLTRLRVRTRRAFP